MELTNEQLAGKSVIYLPYPDFRESARSLSERGLVSSLNALEAVWHMEEKYLQLECDKDGPKMLAPALGWSLTRLKYSWAQWRNFPAAMAMYGYELQAAHGQGRHQKTATKRLATWRTRVDAKMQGGTKWSVALGRKWKNQIDWLGEPRLHGSHRAVLLRKQPSWYRQYGWARTWTTLSGLGLPAHRSAQLWVPYAAWEFATASARTCEAQVQAAAHARHVEWLARQKEREEANGN